MYTDVVSYNIAKLLDNKLYGVNKYAAEDLEVMWDCVSEIYKEGEPIIARSYFQSRSTPDIHGKYYFAPTYGNVIDWLFNEKNVIVKFDPVFTYAAKTHIAYYIEAYNKNEDNGKLDLIFEDKLMMYGFEFAIETILKKILL